MAGVAPDPAMGGDPLAQLRDIHLPDSVPWWPPAPGWWILAGLLIATLLGLVVWALLRYRRDRYRREALQMLQDIQQQKSSAEQLCREINRLLKRVAITVYPRHDSAKLNGADWCAFLHHTAPTVDQDPNLIRLLGGEIYRKDVDEEQVKRLAKYAKSWIRGHRERRSYNREPLAC